MNFTVVVEHETIMKKVRELGKQISYDYKGIIIPDEFVVGYGLDYAGRYRNLRNLCVLNKSNKTNIVF